MNSFQRAFMWLLHREMVRWGAFTLEQVRDFERIERDSRLKRAAPGREAGPVRKDESDGAKQSPKLLKDNGIHTHG